jgi:hypothetical protein
MNPKQILHALVEAYARCLTYRDAGQVITRFLPVRSQPPHISVMPFTTAFSRPDRFRFEYRHRYKPEDEWDRYIVWACDGEVRTWWDVTPGVEQSESLSMALAGATGVSGGSAHTIPALLMPDRVSGQRLTDMVGVTSLGDEPLGGVTCYRLSGRFPPNPIDPTEEERRRQEVIRVTGRPPERAQDSPVTIWIDRRTFLVRRIEEAVLFETFWTEDVTEYEPVIGVSLSEEELQFGAPEGRPA